MKNEHFAVPFFLSALLFLTIAASATAAPMIKEIRFASPNNTVDQIIFEMTGPYLPTGHSLPGENPRIYFDFPEVAPAGNVKNRIAVDGNFIDQIRHAYHKSPQPKTRVVFDLTENRKLDFKQNFDKKSNTLIITLYPTGTEPVLPGIAPAKAEAETGTADQAAASPPVPEDTGKKAGALEEAKTTAVQEISQPPPPQIDQKEPRAESVEPEIEPVQPVETVDIPAPAPKPVIVPAPEPEPSTGSQAAESETEEDTARVASIPSPPPVSIPESVDEPQKEATVIQPMSEIGVQEEGKEESAVPVLQTIDFDPNASRGETISFRLNGFHPPVVFGIEEDIPRIVCFFKNVKAGSSLQDMLNADGRYVKNIKIGKYENPDNIRVVLELTPGNNYDLQQIFFKEDQLYMMIINKAGKKISSQNN